MNKKEKSQIVKVLERLARLEERQKLGFKNIKEDLAEIKESVKTINEETGKLESRISIVEKLYRDAKESFEKARFYWKVLSFFVAPVITFLIICGVKLLLGMPIP